MTPVDGSSVTWHRIGVPKATPTPLGERIKEVVAARGITLNEANRRCGFEQGYLSRVASGERKNPRNDTIEMIAAALGVHVQWLITGGGPRDTGIDFPQYPPELQTAARLYVARGRSVDEIIRAVASIHIEKPQGLQPKTKQWVDLLQAAFNGSLTRQVIAEIVPSVDTGTIPMSPAAMVEAAAGMLHRLDGLSLAAARQKAGSVQLRDPSIHEYYEGARKLMRNDVEGAVAEMVDDYQEPKKARGRANKR